MSNYWLLKEKEAGYLRIIRWAQKHKIKIEFLNRCQIIEVLRMKD